MNLEPTNFDITIHAESGPDAAYTVTASYQGRIANGIFDQDIRQPVWQAAIDQLSNPDKPVGQATITEAGSALFDALMQHDVRDLWMRAQTDLERGSVEQGGVEQGSINVLRIRLALQPAPVAALPWESLYDKNRNQAFAARARTPLVRIENQHRHIASTRDLRADLPIKILLAIPEDPSGQIDEAQEIEQIMALQKTLGPAFLHVEPFTGRFNIIDLRRKVQSTQADILHIVAHGQPDGILLWQRDKPDFAPPSALRTAVEQAESLKLVFLNACLAGQISERDRFATVGPQLLQSGIPAVIAMQYEIVDQTAIDFAQYLYEELISGTAPGAIDVAVGTARSNLYALDPDSFGYGTPILWLNAQDGRIFTTESAAELPVDAASHRTPSTSDANQEADALSARLADLRQKLTEIKAWTAQLPEIEPAGHSRDFQRHLLQPRAQHKQTLADLIVQIDHIDKTLNDGPILPKELEQYSQKLADILSGYEALRNVEAIIQEQLKE